MPIVTATLQQNGTVQNARITTVFNAQFWQVQIGILLLSAILLYAIFRIWPIDHWLTEHYINRPLHHFDLHDDYYLVTIGHEWIKKFLFVIGFILFGLWIASFKSTKYQQWCWPCGFVLLGMILGPSVVGILKSTSSHACPWDLIEYTGHGGYDYPLFGQIPALIGKAKCFPGGHAAGGFGLMAFYFIAKAGHRKHAWVYALAGFLVGMGMGFVQIMRGAHFLSHNLWSAWVVWAALCILLWIITQVFKVSDTQLAAPKKMLS